VAIVGKRHTGSFIKLQRTSMNYARSEIQTKRVVRFYFRETQQEGDFLTALLAIGEAMLK
jgi:hypothetical protein